RMARRVSASLASWATRTRSCMAPNSCDLVIGTDCSDERSSPARRSPAPRSSPGRRTWRLLIWSCGSGMRGQPFALAAVEGPAVLVELALDAAEEVRRGEGLTRAAGDEDGGEHGVL